MTCAHEFAKSMEGNIMSSEAWAKSMARKARCLRCGLELVGYEAGQAIAAQRQPRPRRKSICGRDPDAGPGSCYFWWDHCPAKVGDCFRRHMRQWAKDHGETEDQYEAAVAAWLHRGSVDEACI